MKNISDFFILCSGANRYILDEYPSERVKFSGIGSAIFLTSIFAAVSCFFFLSYLIKTHWLYLVPMCLIWAFLIFTLDRNIIVSIRKTGNTTQEWIQALPRFILAVFIGIVIATPIEMKIFEPEINAKIEQSLDEDRQLSYKINREIYQADIERLNLEIINLKEEINQRENNLTPGIVELNKEIDEKVRRRNNLYINMIAEAEGRSATSKVGKGPVYREKREEYDKANIELQELYNIRDEQIEKNDSQLNELYTRLTSKQADLDAINNQIDQLNLSDNMVIDDAKGVEKRVKALYQLSGIHWFLTLLFILLETLPVLTKLFSRKGPYDEMLARIEYEASVNQKKIISELNDEINNLLQEIQEINKLKSQVRLSSEKAKLDAELKSNQKLLDEISTKQATLARMAINKWYKEEKDLLNSNNNHNYNYISSNSNSHSLEDKLWKKEGMSNLMYLFKDGKTTQKDLIYIDNLGNHTGKWFFGNGNSEINIHLNDMNYKYDILFVNSGCVELKEKRTGEEFKLTLA